MNAILKGKDIPLQPNGRKPYDLGQRKVPIAHFVARETTPANPFLPHKHEVAEVWYVTGGEGFVTLDGQDYAVEPGDLILLEAWVEHGLHTDTKLSWVCIG